MGRPGARRLGAGGADLTGLAVATGYLLGHWGTIGVPPLPATSTTEWLFYVALLVGLVSGVAPWLAGRSALKATLRWGLVVVLLAVTVRPMVLHHWSGLQAVLWTACLTSCGFLLLTSTRVLSNRPTLTGPALSTLLVMVASSATLGLSSTALMAQLAGALAASLTGVLLVVVLGGDTHLAESIRVGLLLLLGLLLNGYLYAQLTTWALVWLLVALPVSWVAHVATGAWGQPPWRKLLTGTLVTLLMVAPPLVQALHSFLSAPVYDY